MKRFNYIFVLLPLAIAGCVREPLADFYTSASVVETYETVVFYNISDNYNAVEWDFGDGTISYAAKPVHKYEQPGFYTIMLRVTGPDGFTSRAFRTIEVLSPVVLEITVLEYYDGYPVANASIILYPTLIDYENETNAVNDAYGYPLEGFTDAYGVVTFEGLRTRSYFLDVWHPNHNNYWLFEDNVNWIKTPPLQRNVINTFIAYVDYTASQSKKDGRIIVKEAPIVLKRAEKPILHNTRQLIK